MLEILAVKTTIVRTRPHPKLTFWMGWAGSSEVDFRFELIA
jgi:hypothetical protein